MFMDCLTDNIKNLGAHVRSQLDKKSEKALIAKIKGELGEGLVNSVALTMMNECNNAFFGLPNKKGSLKVYLLFLTGTDYLEAESEISKVFHEMAVVYKLVQDQSKLDEIKAKIQGKDDLAESWCIVDQEQEEPKVDFDAYFIQQLK